MPGTETHIVDTGHFALEEETPKSAELMLDSSVGVSSTKLVDDGIATYSELVAPESLARINQAVLITVNAGEGT
jgi:hypothetical protein